MFFGGTFVIPPKRSHQPGVLLPVLSLWRPVAQGVALPGRRAASDLPTGHRVSVITGKPQVATHAVRAARNRFQLGAGMAYPARESPF